MVRDLIYNTNGFRLPVNATFGTPTPYIPAAEDKTRNNTVVKVSMPEASHKPQTGQKWIHYQRWDLAKLKAQPNQQIAVPSLPFTLSSLLPQINAYYGTNLALTDFIDVTYTSLVNPITLAAMHSSLAYVGQLTLPITFPLAEAITTLDLNGFTPYGLSAAIQNVNLAGFTAAVS